MSAAIDKASVLLALRQRLAESLERLTAAQASAQSGATHSENRQEHAKDMRSTEASYLSRGLADRAETLANDVATLQAFTPRLRGDEDVVQIGDLVGLVDEGGTQTIYFLAPVGGGEKLDVAGERILVVTPRSPLGEALVGSQLGDVVTIARPAGRVELEVDWVE